MPSEQLISGLLGAGAEARGIIKQRLAEQIAAEALAYEREQQKLKMGQADRRLNIDQFSEDTERQSANTTHLKTTAEIEAEQAERPSTIRLRMAQAGDYEGRPERERLAREHALSLENLDTDNTIRVEGVRHVNELGQIDRRGAVEGGLIDRRVTGEGRLIGMRGDQDRLTDAQKARTGGTGTLPAGIADDLITMQTVSDLIDHTTSIGDQSNWDGVGGFWRGSASQFGARHFGTGTPTAQSLRNNIGNIMATIAKLRGGTAFTKNEQKLLETYTPTIDDDPKMVRQKLSDLKNFIAIKRRTTGQVYGRDLSVPGAAGGSGGGEIEMVRDPKTGKLVRAGDASGAGEIELVRDPATGKLVQKR